MPLFRTILLSLSIFTLLAGEATAASNSGIRTYLTAIEKDGIPSTKSSLDFACQDRIFAILELDTKPKSHHKLVFLWQDPTGKVRERTQYPFTALQAHNRVWAWLKLSGGVGSVFMKWLDPNAGLDEFIGEWMIRFRLDGREVASQRFQVLC
ncbi:MAG TPA: hypothetical protein ENI62_08995 [Gammaproteobacteria bacterium]|nr:hypothetical protein [Gammaproteobacteria bacterium]